MPMNINPVQTGVQLSTQNQIALPGQEPEKKIEFSNEASLIEAKKEILSKGQYLFII